jgi:hypothetical protein
MILYAPDQVRPIPIRHHGHRSHHLRLVHVPFYIDSIPAFETENRCVIIFIHSVNLICRMCGLADRSQMF